MQSGGNRPADEPIRSAERVGDEQTLVVSTSRAMGDEDEWASAALAILDRTERSVDHIAVPARGGDQVEVTRQARARTS